MKSLLLVAIAAFALGYLAGQAGLPAADAPADADSRAPAPGAAVAGMPPAPGVAAGSAAVALRSQPLAPAVTTDGLPEAAEIEAYAQLLHGGPAPLAATRRDSLVARIRAGAQRGSRAEALVLLEALVAVDPGDGDLRLFQSELLQQQGRLVEAMEPLLQVLAAPDHARRGAAAREQLRLLVNVHETQLANRSDYPGLVRFFEELVARDPRDDGHRLRLAHWLLQYGAVADAERVALEIGSAGVTDAAREDLFDQIRLARDGFPLEQDGRGLHVRATIGGRPARLLVDTGASTTVVSVGFARALGSRALESGVRVRTAGGVVSGERHRVRDLRVGGLHLAELDVLVLEHVPAAADGLLGMDVLGRVPAGMLPAALLGRPPASG